MRESLRGEISRELKESLEPSVRHSLLKDEVIVNGVRKRLYEEMYEEVRRELL